MDRKERKKAVAGQIAKVIFDMTSENKPQPEAIKTIERIIQQLINMLTIEILTEINEAKFADKIEREKDKKLTDLILNTFTLKSIFMEQKTCSEYMAKKVEIDKLIKNKFNEYKTKYGLSE